MPAAGAGPSPTRPDRAHADRDHLDADHPDRLRRRVRQRPAVQRHRSARCSRRRRRSCAALVSRPLPAERLSLRLPYRAPFHSRVDLRIPGRPCRTRRRVVGRRDVPPIVATEPRQRGDRGLARTERAGTERGDVHVAPRQRRRCAGRGAAMPSNVRPRRRSRHRRDATSPTIRSCPARSQASRAALARSSRRCRTADPRGARPTGVGQGRAHARGAAGRGRRRTPRAFRSKASRTRSRRPRQSPGAHRATSRCLLPGPGR